MSGEEGFGLYHVFVFVGLGALYVRNNIVSSFLVPNLTNNYLWLTLLEQELLIFLLWGPSYDMIF